MVDQTWHNDLENSDYYLTVWDTVLVPTSYGRTRVYIVRIYREAPVLAYEQEHVESSIIKDIEDYEQDNSELGEVDRRYAFVWGCLKYGFS